MCKMNTLNTKNNTKYVRSQEILFNEQLHSFAWDVSYFLLVLANAQFYNFPT
jgi:hypothetical protein